MKNLILVILIILLISPSLSAERRGFITAQTCPHSCKTMGLNKRDCKDWREGDTCYVEDLKRPRSRTSAPTGNIGSRPLPVTQPTPIPNHFNIPTPTSFNPTQCQSTGQYYARPRINIERVYKTGNFFKDKLKVRGTLEGVCIVEAGVFEDGRKVESIRVDSINQFRRFNFDVVVRQSNFPEIRVYNANGDSDYYEVRSEDVR